MIRAHKEKVFGFKKGKYQGHGFKKGKYQGFGFKKGDVSPRKGLSNEEYYGKEMSEKIKNKFLKKMKGREFTEEHKRNISIANKGKQRSEEHRKNISGKNSHLWKGGITAINKQIRTMGKYLQWRADVFKRDNYHCQHCGNKGYLHAHHIIPLSKIMDEFNIKYTEEASKCKILWDIGNGITYCKECHVLLDEHIGRRRKIPC